VGHAMFDFHGIGPIQLTLILAAVMFAAFAIYKMIGKK
jgi:hypothetical protein